MPLSAQATRLGLLIASTQTPLVSDSELEAIIARHGTATTWITGTAYTYGQRILPTVLNGHVYKCITAGTSSATEPTWPLCNFDRIYDGSVLIWQEDGLQPAELFDYRAAAYEGWLLKAGRCANALDVKSASGTAINRQALKDSCLEMAQVYVPIVMV